MTVKINKPAINLREELASLRNQGGLPKEDKLYVETLENGDFSAGTVGWTEYNYLASVSASNGQLTVTSTGTTNGSFAYQKINTKIGKTYKVTATVVSTGAAYVRANLNTIHPWNYDGGISFSGTANVTKEFTFVASQDHIYLGLGTANTSVGLSATYSSITVQEVGENLVTNGTFDSGTTGWVAEHGATATVTNGELVVGDGAGLYSRVNQEINMPKNITYTLSVQARVGTGTSFEIRLGNSSSTTTYGSHLAQTVSGTYNLTFTPNAGEDIKIYLYSNSSDNGGTAIFDNVILTEGNHNIIQSIPHGYDVKDVYIDGELAREGEAYDYEVKTDGINQWLKPTIEPTATTETAVIGVRK